LYIVLDNARAHIGKEVKDYCQRQKIELMFMPGYSPEFNCIEALWSVIKRRVKARLAFRKDVNIEEQGFRNLVLNVLEDVTPEEQQKAAASNNRHYLHRTIGDIIDKLKKEKKEMMMIDDVGSNQVSSDPDE
jgi:hypothetical protein